MRHQRNNIGTMDTLSLSASLPTFLPAKFTTYERWGNSDTTIGSASKTNTHKQAEEVWCYSDATVRYTAKAHNEGPYLTPSRDTKQLPVFLEGMPSRKTIWNKNFERLPRDYMLGINSQSTSMRHRTMQKGVRGEK